MTTERLQDEALYAEVDPVMRVFRQHHPQAPVDGLVSAYRLAHRRHEGQFRKSGEPFITHPLAVAQILADYGMEQNALIAALLHDTVEDTDLTLDEIETEFGAEVAMMIDGVTKLDRIRFESPAQAQAATIRKMVVAMAQDVRVLLIKLADRLHNVRTIGALRTDKQRRVALETLEVYAPLAHRLGVQEIKHEMENRCFSIVYPKRYQEIEELIFQRSPQREAVIEKSIAELEALLDGADISAEVTGRPKHHYSIYRKMIETGQPFDEIHDLIGLRVVAASEQDCYASLGLVHSIWPPLHGRFKDYIAMPKFNLYQSIHTTVIGPDRKPLEVQLRSWEMHQRAEFGIAAHWRYKEGVGSAELPWLADIRLLQEEYPDPEEFLANLKLDLYEDEVFVTTPKGDIISLPKGATPVDFAYNVHTEVGHHCVGSRVNGRLVALDTTLESGDIVEILTSKSATAHPSRDWLSFVRSARARSKIRQWFSRQRRQKAVTSGRERVIELIRREGLGISARKRDRLVEAVAAELGYKDPKALYGAVGEGTVSGANVVTRIARALVPQSESEEPEAVDLLAPPKQRSAGTAGIVVEGLDDMWTRVARCCGPVPGDPIVGFVTVGRGVSVHSADCTNVASLDEHRMIEVAWAPEQEGSFGIWVQVEALDRSGLLRDVTATVTDLGGNIVASSSATGRDRVAVLRYEVELSDPDQVQRVLGDLRSVEGVYEVFRIMPQGGL